MIGTNLKGFPIKGFKIHKYVHDIICIYGLKHYNYLKHHHLKIEVILIFENTRVKYVQVLMKKVPMNIPTLFYEIINERNFFKKMT